MNARLFDVPIDALDLETVKTLPGVIVGPRVLATMNVQHLVKIDSCHETRNIYLDTDYIVCDSQIIRKLGQIIFHTKVPLLRGSDLVEDLIADTRHNNAIAIIGPSLTDVATVAKQYGAALCFAHTPSRADLESASYLRQIVQLVESTKPAFVFVCLGFPRQERFANEIRNATGHACLLICAGGSVDFLSGRQLRAPKFFRSCGLEWLFRLMTRPSLYKRYLPDFIRLIRLIRRSES